MWGGVRVGLELPMSLAMPPPPPPSGATPYPVLFPATCPSRVPQRLRLSPSPNISPPRSPHTTPPHPRFESKSFADGSVKLCSLERTGWHIYELDLAPHGVRTGAGGGAGSVARGGGTADAAVASTTEPSPSLPPRTQFLLQQLDGISQALILENQAHELKVIVPSHAPYRPKVDKRPFGTCPVFDRSDRCVSEWVSGRNQDLNGSRRVV